MAPKTSPPKILITSPLIEFVETFPLSSQLWEIKVLLSNFLKEPPGAEK